MKDDLLEILSVLVPILAVIGLFYLLASCGYDSTTPTQNKTYYRYNEIYQHQCTYHQGSYHYNCVDYSYNYYPVYYCGWEYYPTTYCN